MRVLDVPPIISQNEAVLPDGTIDPAHATDCGEACISSALASFRRLHLGPGCIRQALGLPADNGRTTSQEIARFATSLGLKAQMRTDQGADLWTSLSILRHHGRMLFCLVHFEGSGPLHWMLAYERGAEKVRLMDPWTGSYVELTKAFMVGWNAGEQVGVHE